VDERRRRQSRGRQIGEEKEYRVNWESRDQFEYDIVCVRWDR
jgi:hypothetical protein